MNTADHYLQAVAKEIDLNPTRRESAETSYNAVARWLETPPSKLQALAPDLFPQGSMALGTTNKPYGQSEFDVDLVAGLSLPSSCTPSDAMNLVAGRLMESEIYGRMLEVKTRCLRLHYQGEFHLDIVPSRYDEYGEYWIGDDHRQLWEMTRPRQYRRWFNAKAALECPEPTVSLRSAEPLPPPEGVGSKGTLRKAVQIVKYCRDVYFDGNDFRPASMLLTTIVAKAYSGTTSLSEAISLAIDYAVQMACSDHAMVCENPVLPEENLARGIIEPSQIEQFISFFREMKTLLNILNSSDGLVRINDALAQMAGNDVAGAAIESVADQVNGARPRSGLYWSGAAGLNTSSLGRTVPDSRFFGT